MINYKDGATRVVITLASAYILGSIAFAVNTQVSLGSINITLANIEHTLSSMKGVDNAQAAQILKATLKDARIEIDLLAMKEQTTELKELLTKAREDCVRLELDLAILEAKQH